MEPDNKKTIDSIADANVLIKSFDKSKKGVTWKQSVQKYELNLLQNTYHTRKKLKNKTYTSSKFVEFPLSQRGKTRWIKSVHIKDRVVQRALCDQVLLPNLTKYLIYDNGASLAGKGIDFTLDRLKKHLHDYYKKYHDNKGYIILVDFSKYFDNIPHAELVKYLTRDIEDQDLIDLIKYLVSLFRIDTRFIPKEMQLEFKNGIFNNLKYSAYIYEHNKKKKIVNKDGNPLEKSIGVGSQISQIGGVYYPTPMDNFFKIVKGIKPYARYMDDAYIIVRTYQEAKEALKAVYEISESLHIHVNKKKTQVRKLNQPFTFLKIRHHFLQNGTVIRKVSRDNVTRNIRKMKKLSTKLEDNELTFQQAQQPYASFRGRLCKFNNRETRRNCDKLFNHLYIENWHYVPVY